MLTNTDLTLFRKVYDATSRLDVWQSQYIPSAWWFKDEQSSVNADGFHSADKIKIRIPQTDITISKEDIIVKGKCDVEIVSPKDLNGYEYCKVMSVNYNLFGDTPHIKLGGQ